MRGFSLVELLIVTVLASMVIASAFQLFISQTQLFVVQREVMDVRETLRSSVALLTFDLREISASDSDLYSAEADSLVLRSVVGAGVICSHAWNGASRRLGIQHSSGTFETSSLNDTLLSFSLNEDIWSPYRITQVWEPPAAWLPGPGGGGTPTCFWGDRSMNEPRPELTVEVAGDSVEMAKLFPGAPVRAFKRTVYALYEWESRWYLGRRVGNAVGYELLTGPMLSPEDGGFVVRYFDPGGVATDVPSNVVRVEMTLTAESSGRSRNGTQVDSVTTVVFLRNN